MAMIAAAVTEKSATRSENVEQRPVRRSTVDIDRRTGYDLVKTAAETIPAERRHLDCLRLRGHRCSHDHDEQKGPTECA